MSRMQKVVWEREGWGARYGLTFNAWKTEVIIFTRATLSAPQLPNRLLMGDTQVEFSSHAQYLGIILDHKLNCLLQIDR